MCTDLRIRAGSVQPPAQKLLRDLGDSPQQTQHDVTRVTNSKSK